MKNKDISVIKDIVNGVAILGILDRNSSVLSAVLEKFTSKSGNVGNLDVDTFSQDEDIRSTFCVIRNGVALLDKRTMENFNVRAVVHEDELPPNVDVHQLFQNYPQSTDTQPAFPLPPGLNLNPVAAMSDEEQEEIFKTVGEFIYAVVESFTSNTASVLLEQKSTEETGKEKNVDLLPQTFQLKEQDIPKENKGTESNNKRVAMPAPIKVQAIRLIPSKLKP